MVALCALPKAFRPHTTYEEDIMNQQQPERQPLSTIAKIGYGILLSDIVFVAYQFILIKSTEGSESWDGMLIFFGTLFIAPGLLVANCWVIPYPWKRKGIAWLAGLMIPAVIGAIEFLWLHGPDKVRWAIKSAMAAPLWVWLFILLPFVPLLISVMYTIRRRSHGDKQ